MFVLNTLQFSLNMTIFLRNTNENRNVAKKSLVKMTYHISTRIITGICLDSNNPINCLDEIFLTKKCATEKI